MKQRGDGKRCRKASIEAVVTVQWLGPEADSGGGEVDRYGTYFRSVIDKIC